MTKTMNIKCTQLSQSPSNPNDQSSGGSTREIVFFISSSLFLYFIASLCERALIDFVSTVQKSAQIKHVT